MPEEGMLCRGNSPYTGGEELFHDGMDDRLLREVHKAGLNGGNISPF